MRAPIFDRDAQRMRLTAAGELLQSRVEGMMREFARTKSHIAALQNLQAGTVDVYTFQAAIDGFITPVLRDYHKQYPNVLFKIITSSTDETIKALANGVAEIALVLNPPGSGGQMLKQCGDGLTHENVMRQAAKSEELQDHQPAAQHHDQHQPDRFCADQASAAQEVQEREAK